MMKTRTRKIYSIILLLLLGTFHLWATPTLNSADLAVVAWNTDLDDQFAIVALAEIPGNSVIFLTDEGWDDNGFDFDGDEDVFQWTLPDDGLSAGTIIRFTNESKTTLELMQTTYGTLEHKNGSSDMNLQGGDQLFIYQTNNNLYDGVIQRMDGNGGIEAGMIYAFNGDDFMPCTYGWLDAGNEHSSMSSQLPDNMTALSISDGTGNATTANANGMLTQADLKDQSVDEWDNYRYDGPNTGTDKSGWLKRIHTVANWKASDSDTLGVFQGVLADDWLLATVPDFSINDLSLSYTKGGEAIPVDSLATASDVDSYLNLATGRLLVQITGNNEAGDRLSIADNVVGNINTCEKDLFDEYEIIGTLNTNEGTVTNGKALLITFSYNATNERVQQVIRSIYYENTSENPGMDDRTITFTLIDRDSLSTIDTRTIKIVKNILTVTAENKTRTYGQENPILTFTYAGFINGEDESVLTIAPTISTTATGSSAAGTYPIKVEGASAANYDFNYVDGELTVSKLDQMIIFPALTNKTYGDASFELYATASSGLCISYESSDEKVAKVSGTTVTIVGAGTASITASQIGNTNYLTAENAMQSLTVSKLPITVTANANQTKEYSDNDPIFTYTLSPNLIGNDTFTGSLTRAEGENVGAYAIAQGDLNNSNYAITFESADFTITTKTITVTADADQTKLCGDADPTLTYTVSPSLISGDSFNGTLGRETGEGTGIYAITRNSLSAGTNYIIDFRPANFTITIATTIDNSKVNILKIYPNPAVTSITIEGAQGWVTLYNMSGKAVLKYNLNQGKNIDISNLANGIYMLSVNGKTIKVGKK